MGAPRALDRILRGETGLFADESVRPGGLLSLPGTSGLTDLGIGEDTVLDVDQAPLVLSSHRIFVAAAQEALILEVLQFLDLGGITLGLGDKKLDGAFVLLAGIDQPLFLIALRLHGNAGKLHIEGDGDIAAIRKTKSRAKPRSFLRRLLRATGVLRDLQRSARV